MSHKVSLSPETGGRVHPSSGEVNKGILHAFMSLNRVRDKSQVSGRGRSGVSLYRDSLSGEISLSSPLQRVKQDRDPQGSLMNLKRST